MKKFLLGLLVILVAAFFILKMNTTTSKTDTLQAQFDEIEQLITQRDVKNEAISKVDVAWHLDHMLKTANGISSALRSSNPKAYEKPSFSFTRLAVMGFGFIPRGRGQAPDSVRPPDTILTEDINKQLEEARKLIEMANALPEDAHFDHPVFGTLNRPATLRFIEVHTEHHLKIVRDIIKK